MKVKSMIFIVLFLLAAVLGFSYEKEKDLRLDAEGITEFELDCGAGYLKIKGEPGLKQVEVKAAIVIKGIDEEEIDDFIADKITLSLKKWGDKAVLTSKVESFSAISLFKSRTVQINLDVRVPQNLALDIDDGSGAIEIAHISNDIQIDDGSGSIDIEDVDGKISIEDGSGSIDMVQVTGNVRIEDGSGSITLEKIKGNLKIDDSSGEIKVEDVSGDVNIDDSSGDMRIYKIGGSVVVDDGSGGIYIDGVEKDVIIKRSGSGSVDIHNVKGKVKK